MARDSDTTDRIGHAMNDDDLQASIQTIMKRIKDLPEFAESAALFDKIAADPEARRALSIASGIPERLLFNGPFGKDTS
jgi:hypothetical protein